MGVSPDDITVTAVQESPPDGPWSVSAVVNAGEDAAKAQQLVEDFAEATPEEMASDLGLPPGSVQDVAPATVAVDVKPAPGAVETNTVTLDFHVAADAYDPETSPAAYAAALAAKMGVSPEDVTVIAHQEEDGTWTIKAVVDAGED